MNNYTRQFTRDSQQGQFTILYYPSHISIKYKNHIDNMQKQTKIFDSSLTPSIKQQCEHVDDLFQYLQSLDANSLQISQNNLKFKVVRIKKERWYDLPLNTAQSIKKQNNQYLKLKQNYKSLEKQNKKLNQQVKRLMSGNRRLRNDLANLNTKFNKNYKDSQIQKKSTFFNLSSQLYFRQGSLVTKISKQQGVFPIGDRMRQDTTSKIGIQIKNKLSKNTIIFGICTQQQLYKPFCFYNEESVCYAGSLSNIFAGIQAFDTCVILNENDIIEVILDPLNSIVQWVYNGSKMLVHRLPYFLKTTCLYPYIMLYQINDTINVIK